MEALLQVTKKVRARVITGFKAADVGLVHNRQEPWLSVGEFFGPVTVCARLKGGSLTHPSRLLSSPFPPSLFEPTQIGS